MWLTFAPCGLVVLLLKANLSLLFTTLFLLFKPRPMERQVTGLGHLRKAKWTQRERRGERRGEKETYRSEGTGTPRELTQPKMRGAWPVRARASSMRELAKKHEFVADSTAVRSTALTTCTAAPKPARWKTTVIGDAATSESVRSNERRFLSNHRM